MEYSDEETRMNSLLTFFYRTLYTIIYLAKAWTAINRLSIIRKFDFSIKQNGIFPSCDIVNTTLWMHHKDAKKWKKWLIENYTKILS